MTSLFDAALALLKLRGLKFVDEFIPSFLTSYSCHSFNLRNRGALFVDGRGETVYWENRGIPDTRLHLLFVAPPGFSKSTFMKHCFTDENGILNTENIGTTFEQSCTEAGWVGGFGREGNKIMGLAEEFKRGIVSIEEFQAITAAMQQKHSLGFESQLNSSLFDGNVRKRLLTGSIKYHTDISLIGGTQITRFDISGGLGRRFNYIFWVPTDRDFQVLKDAIRYSKSLPPNIDSLIDYRCKLEDWQKSLMNIKSVTFSDRLYDLMSMRPHFEQIVYRKLALGYHLFTSERIGSDVEVTIDSRLIKILRQAIDWRLKLLADPEGALVLEVIRRHQEDYPKGITSRQLQYKLLNYSLSYETSFWIIDRLSRTNQIWMKNNKYKAN